MSDYRQDGTGQWWYYAPRGNRTRIQEQTCQLCDRPFITHHKQQFCSQTCRSASQKGVLRVQRTPRPCEWCKTIFTPRKVSQAPKTCSRGCGIDMGNTKRGRSGPANARWKGGIKSHSAGYVRQYVPSRQKFDFQHRLVMERVLGRPLVKGEEVHHKNGIRHDNRPENLELWLKRQPGGQRVKDLLEYAHWVLATYEPLALQGKLF